MSNFLNTLITYLSKNRVWYTYPALPTVFGSNPIVDFVPKYLHPIVPVETMRTNKEPCYCILDNVIRMKEKYLFITEGFYYSTLFHEYVHATGDKNHLGRAFIEHTKKTSTLDVNSIEYAQEEITAEIGAMLLMQYFSINTPTTFENSIGYVKYYFHPNISIYQCYADGCNAANYLFRNYLMTAKNKSYNSNYSGAINA